MTSKPLRPLVIVNIRHDLRETHAIVEGVRSYVSAHELDWEVVVQSTVIKHVDGQQQRIFPPIPVADNRPALLISRHPPERCGIGSRQCQWVQWIAEGGSGNGQLAVSFAADAIGRLAANYLLANGARSLAIRQAITARQPVQEQARLRAFIAAAAERGFQVAQLWSDKNIDYWLSLESSCRTMPKPIGLFCYHDRVAEWAIADLKRLGVAVPKDVMVLGGNGSSAAAAAQLPISSVRLPFFNLGQVAATQAHILLSGGQADQQVVLVPPMVVDERESTVARLSEDPFIVKAMKRIEARERALPTVQELAECCGCSRQYLLQRFKRELGFTPAAWLHERAMRRATLLLADTDFSLQKIARLCGFAHSSNLCRRFKQHYGMTTTQFRRRNIC